MCSDSPLGDPTCVFFHGTAPLTVSPCLSLAETFCRLCCVVISPRLAESTSETSICSTAPDQSICVIPTWYLLTQDVASVAFPYLRYAFPVLSIPTVRNSSGGHLCLSPVLSSVPTGWGDLPASAGHWRGSAIVAFSKGIPLVSHTDVTSNVTD